MAAKLSKKELKSPDAFQTTFEKAGEYIRENKSRVIIAGTALACAVVLALGIYFYWSYYSGAALKLYARAQDNILKSGDNPETEKANIPIFRELAEQYPHSWSGRMAHYHLANIYYNQGDLDRAIVSYEAFIAKTGSDKTGVKFLALTSLGYVYEAKKDFQSALKYFEQAQKVYHTGFEMMSLRNVARAHEALNDKAKALEYYQKALEKAKDPAARLFLQKKIAELG
ncbi:MAG TPA: tetratricopeptide repeat protein [Smithellaceae bacterium]|nr:tetratricopeptide repeat protein [Smithellaceae bacterium]HRS82328.1 tetratricopeptide repeat protein [Smithellaceae bacterium]HRV43816.1 tetratricopeptide repeat protein [Smithellaceae bacterium]